MERRVGALPNEWYWGGYPGHFIGGADCRFHLSTVVGNYLVSTVGDYHPRGSQENGPVNIGADRLFETMVFHCEGLDLDMNLILPDLQPIEMIGYSDSLGAERGHYMVCKRFAGK